MHLTPREFDKLLIYMMAEVALKRRQQGLKLNHPEAVAVISAAALDGVKISSDGLLADIHGSAAYRANLVKVMAQRAVTAAG